MRRTRFLAMAALSLLGAACSDPTGTGTVTRFDGHNTMGSGTSLAPGNTPSLDGGNMMGSGNRGGGVPTDTTSSVLEAGATDERGHNTMGSGN